MTQFSKLPLQPVSHDVIIIGGGSAGYAAARTAEAEGANVGIIDHGPLGGLCILRGCMPTKTILRSSDIAALIRRAPEFGLRSSNLQANLSAIIDRKNRLIKEFTDYRIQSLQHPKFTLYQEKAHFLSPTLIQAGPHQLAAKAFIVATGSVVSRIPIPGLEEAGYLTSDDALELRKTPDSMIVLGGGAVALELAQFFSRIGVKVSLIQRSEQIMSQLDKDLVLPVVAKLQEEGMTIYANTSLERVTRSSDGQKTVDFLHHGQPKQVTATTILQALGRRPNIDGLGLEMAQVDIQNRTVVVNETMQTSQPHIFAVGDVNGLHEIVHIAIEQGEIAGWNAVHPDQAAKQFNERLKAQVIFTDPQVASVGLSERECQAHHIPFLVASYPFNDHGKSLCLGELHGHVKILCHPHSGEILGGHIVGPEASELIHEIIAVMYFHGTVRDLLRIPHYHPTLAEILTYPAEELADQLPPVL
ncbi:MAG: dihydrolipoyl dehydrogenase [Nitrospirota bacterium]|nr:dihydrolipoyl dehydrogenase [Nitrospirota bacterium]MDX2419625.1 dihydrolipoyl dehydrogenase [Nitrospirota bacterium]